jgi:hypothetical protein
MQIEIYLPWSHDVLRLRSNRGEEAPINSVLKFHCSNLFSCDNFNFNICCSIQSMSVNHSMFVVNTPIQATSVENVFTRLENGQHFDCGINVISEQC